MKNFDTQYGKTEATEGACVGLFDGSYVGLTVGSNIGKRVGSLVGAIVTLSPSMAQKDISAHFLILIILLRARHINILFENCTNYLNHSHTSPKMLFFLSHWTYMTMEIVRKNVALF